MKPIIHFNNAGAALMPEIAVKAMREFQVLEQSLGGYEAAQANAQTYGPSLANFKDAAAKLVGTLPENIAEMPNATAAWQRPFAAIAFRPGDRIITHELEYGSNYMSILAAAQQYGAKIDIVRASDTGEIDLEHLGALITPRTRLISVTHVAAHSGTVQPVEAIGKLARQHNILYFLDSSQAVGQLPVDVQKIGCAVMAATGRKFLRGPRGTGFLYASPKFCAAHPPRIAEIQSAFITDDGALEFYTGAQRYETWETSISARIGLTKSIEYALSIGIETIARDIAKLSDYAEKQIAQNTRFSCASKGARQSAILAIKLDVPAELAQKHLNQNNINVSVISPSAAPLKLQNQAPLSMIRMSLHNYNTSEEIDKFVQVLSDIT